MRLFASLTALAVTAALTCPLHAETNSQGSTTAPAAPLHADAGAAVTLRWTSPGDDSLTGTARFYDLRYSVLPITTLSFYTTTWAVGVPAPALAGTQQAFTVKGLVPNKLYYFAIRTVDRAGNWSAMSNVVSKVASTAVGVSPDGARITDLSHPSPNPARSHVSFAMSMANAGNVEIDVFDITGRHVRTLARGPWAMGDGSVTWDLRDDGGGLVPSAMYKVRARLGTQQFVRSVVVVR